MEVFCECTKPLYLWNLQTYKLKKQSRFFNLKTRTDMNFPNDQEVWKRWHLCLIENSYAWMHSRIY